MPTPTKVPGLPAVPSNLEADLKAYLKENILFEEDLKLSDEQLKLVAKAVKQPVEKVEKVTTGQEKVTEEELNEKLFKKGTAILKGTDCDMHRQGDNSHLKYFFRF